MVFTTVWSISTDLSKDLSLELGPFASFRQDARTTRPDITKQITKERSITNQPEGSTRYLYLGYGCKLAGVSRTFAGAAFSISK